MDTPLQTSHKSKENLRRHLIPSWVEAMQEELLQFKIQNEERIDYDEVFAPVSRIEAIRLFLAYASFMGFTVYQMDVKSAFLYGTIDEEVGTIDKTLFIRRQRGDFILVQGHPKLGLWYPKESPFDLVTYSDSDYGGATQDCKSTTGGKYVTAASCCGQVLWIQNQLLDYREIPVLI
nr:putative ribonuclease H-like domain-containing protein [Tanacetum cinerariifolium]